ncbi:MULTISPECIES: hypothetical protein [unclassified Arcicella]|uniref:hypothetical protein n=1 Tax=unclassified Arcicella TaxID=2644986 RepID=UPI00285584B9|nr:MULTISPECIES: hypothetical protein [unclassified Arcicella]MDR6565006.1 hypothetical protein [Arcicella sp. BE51]MDR6814815.1 hypothetical protein [Arcicella sp. BE140]MDR6826261.1 hypothetical protein [Arcicella sp. BE139]
MSDNNNELPIWRIILSIVSSILLITRLVTGCSNHNANNRFDDERFKEELEVITESKNEQFSNQENIKSNDMLYAKYIDIDMLSQEIKEQYGISKLVRDSLILLDIDSKIKIRKNYYFQKNYDDSLRYAFKSPKDLNIFIHSFTAKGKVEENFRSLKGNSYLKEFKSDHSIKNVQLFHYSIIKNNMQFNGYAVMMNYENDNLSFMEFESNQLNKKELRKLLLRFLTENIIFKN